MPKRFDTPWMNEETLAAIILKRRLWKKYKYCRNQRNIERYEEEKKIKILSERSKRRM
jgi:hypothetical protein